MKLKKIIKKYYIYLTVFITGAVILILEILGTRIIAPYYGTTVYVWSSLITVTLVALSIGYFFGGRLADKKPESNEMYLIIFLAGLFILLIPQITSFVLTKTNSLGPRYGALSSSAILFTVPLFLLGMVAPYAIKLKAKELVEIGITAGSLYGVATIGSFIGAVLTGFYLIPGFGIKSIVYMTSFLLFAVSGIWFLITRKYKRLCILVIIALALLLIIPSPDLNGKDSKMKLLYKTNSVYGEIKVMQKDNDRYLLVNNAAQSAYDLYSKKFEFSYLSLFEKAVKYNPEAEKVLIIGLGGGGVNHILKKYDLEVDTVEIDPKVEWVAREYFDFEGDVIIQDGRYYIQNIGEKYDIIFFDAASGFSVSPHLLTLEMFKATKAILNSNGIVVINTNGRADDELQKAIYKTLKQVFGNVYVKAVGYDFTNVVFYASDNTLEIDNQYISHDIDVDENTVIIIDNYNPVEFLSIGSIEELMEDTRGHFKDVI